MQRPLRDKPDKLKGPGRGRPRVHAESWAKVSVVLFVRQVTHLDTVAKQARKHGHKSITRASIIRGLIDGLIHSGLDLRRHPSETALREHVAKRLRPTVRAS
jgi:hypothetical protein